MRFVSFAFFAGLILAATNGWAQFAQIAPETRVCRAGQCRPAGTYEPKLLFEQIHLMLRTNLGETAKICTGTQSCLGTGISVPVTTQGGQQVLTLSQANLVDVDGEIQPPQIGMIFAYQAHLNSFIPTCESATTTLDMTNRRYLSLTSNEFSCGLTHRSKAKVRVSFVLDYIDLGAAVMGGSYTLSVSGGAIGQMTGHAFLKLPKRTPVTLDAKSIGLVYPDKNELIAQLRARLKSSMPTVNARDYRGGFETPILNPAQGYKVPLEPRYGAPQLLPMQVPMQMPVYDPAYMLNYAAPISVPPVVYMQ